jgi:VanZ family protein
MSQRLLLQLIKLQPSDRYSLINRAYGVGPGWTEIMERLVALMRVFAWLSVVAIVALSIVPGSYRPHVLPLPKLEHLAAYFIAGSVVAVGFLEYRQCIVSGLCLTFLAGALEVGQLWIPGRESKLTDWVVSSLGAWSGITAVLFACWVCQHLLRSHRRRVIEAG